MPGRRLRDLLPDLAPHRPPYYREAGYPIDHRPLVGAFRGESLRRPFAFVLGHIPPSLYVIVVTDETRPM